MPERILDPLVPRASRYQHRLLYALILLLVVLIGGTLGYWVIEGWGALDSLYMTVITMATIGYGETHPLSDAGRLFTIGLIIISIGTAGYAVSTLAAFVLEGEFYRLLQERRMDQRIAKLSDHVILCGGGRTGRYIADEFFRTGTPFVLVEQNAEILQNTLQIGDIPYLHADATQDEALRMAGIERARGLVAALGEDKDNLFVVLSARALNARLRIIARVSDDANAGKLRIAGADEVVSPNAIGGLRMASIMLRPTVVTFLDEMLRVPGQTLRVDEVHIDKIPRFTGKSLGETDIGRKTGMLVMAIKSSQSGYQFNPGANTILKPGDILIVVGTREQIARLHETESG
ncbi:MAG: potassium channel protein [Chloroflexi bacterium]|nr:potassium channel protein [Chloroflexota bacterium]